MTKYCRVDGCGVELTDENWSPSLRNMNSRICKKCDVQRTRSWAIANRDKVKASWTRYIRKKGHLPYSENKECPQYLGIHIAEELLRHYFNDVEVMPFGNPGYDFICNKGWKVDAKSSCLLKDRKSHTWQFNINRNTIADFFVCVAFDNREDLNVLHVWMIPGEKLNHLMNASIRPSTVHKWDQYKLDIDKVSSCCNEMKDAARGGE